MSGYQLGAAGVGELADIHQTGLHSPELAGGRKFLAGGALPLSSSTYFAPFCADQVLNVNPQKQIAALLDLELDRGRKSLAACVLTPNSPST